MSQHRLERQSATQLKILNQYNIDARLFAMKDVPIENSAIQELLTLLQVASFATEYAERFPTNFSETPRLVRAAITPDFHKGAGIPVGTVLATQGFFIPAAVGNDINCGMRVYATSLPAEYVEQQIPKLEQIFRHAFFEGGRNIPMTRKQREAMLRDGLLGLLDTVPQNQTEGLWESFHRRVENELNLVDLGGSLHADHTLGLDDYLGQDGLSRDSQIGSIGGGNHFVEIQRIEQVLEGGTAHAWGFKAGMVAVMVHSGSVAVGHNSGAYCRNLAQQLHPTSLEFPKNNIFILPDGEQNTSEVQLFWDCLHNAANFAFANRLFLSLMALEALEMVCGNFDAQLLYDAPHNMIWREELDGEPIYLHRKGACPARGLAQMSNSPFAFYGEPVLVPGSMGASSFILAGQGNTEALWSASHGAGRAMSRGDAAHGHDVEFKEFMERFHIVTPVDLRRPDIQMRNDIVTKKLEDIKKEAPFAYKGIGPVIETLNHGGIARPIVELTPLVTIKG